MRRKREAWMRGKGERTDSPERKALRWEHFRPLRRYHYLRKLRRTQAAAKLILDAPMGPLKTWQTAQRRHFNEDPLSRASRRKDETAEYLERLETEGEDSG